MSSRATYVVIYYEKANGVARIAGRYPTRAEAERISADLSLAGYDARIETDDDE